MIPFFKSQIESYFYREGISWTERHVFGYQRTHLNLNGLSTEDSTILPIEGPTGVEKPLIYMDVSGIKQLCIAKEVLGYTGLDPMGWCADSPGSMWELRNYASAMFGVGVPLASPTAKDSIVGMSIGQMFKVPPLLNVPKNFVALWWDFGTRIVPGETESLRHWYVAIGDKNGPAGTPVTDVTVTTPSEAKGGYTTVEDSTDVYNSTAHPLILYPGVRVTGIGIPANTTVVSWSTVEDDPGPPPVYSYHVVLSNPASANGSGITLTFQANRSVLTRAAGSWVTDNVYKGCKITGTGIPSNTYITEVDLDADITGKTIVASAVCANSPITVTPYHNCFVRALPDGAGGSHVWQNLQGYRLEIEYNPGLSVKFYLNGGLATIMKDSDSDIYPYTPLAHMVSHARDISATEQGLCIFATMGDGEPSDSDASIKPGFWFPHMNTHIWYSYQ